MFRYFAWKDGGFWCGQTLLTENQIRECLRNFKWKYETFASIQSYDQDGNIVSSPLYADFDGEGALEDTRFAFQVIKDLLLVEPKVYFSGNKGYHLILPVEIKHPRCHDVARSIMLKISSTWKALDLNVYRNRSMLRLPKSPASKPGYFKTQLSPEELELDIGIHQEFATKHHNDKIPEPNLSALNKAEWEKWLSTAIADLPSSSKEVYSNTTLDKEARPWSDCLQALLEIAPNSGGRHNIVFLLARWYVQAGYDYTDTMKAFLAHKHWYDFEQEEGGVSKVVKSILKSGKIPTLGCKYDGIDKDLMKQHCNQFCEYNLDWSPL